MFPLPARIAVILFLAFAASGAAACQQARYPSGARGAVPEAGIDQALFSRAVAAEVNRYRCAHDLQRLRYHRGLTRAAATHSAWMAKAGAMVHTSTVGGQRTLLPRLKGASRRFVRGAENIAYQSACGRSYAGLARMIVRMWYDSPPHRRNMVKPRVSHLGAGAFPRGGCRRVYMTLDLAG